MKHLMILMAVAMGMASAQAAEPAKSSMAAAVMPAGTAAQPALHPGKPVTTAVIPGSLQAATTPESAAVKKVAPATPVATPVAK